jgi:hypothetical protein
MQLTNLQEIEQNFTLSMQWLISTVVFGITSVVTSNFEIANEVLKLIGIAAAALGAIASLIVGIDKAILYFKLKYKK